jgi:hypothetical protein
MGLMVARQRFGESSLESFEIALILDNLVVSSLLHCTRACFIH